ncbi:hypothetical protein ABKA04_009991 [Annulohypoxylon sp. FPYF3050]
MMLMSCALRASPRESGEAPENCVEIGLRSRNRRLRAALRSVLHLPLGTRRSPTPEAARGDRRLRAVFSRFLFPFPQPSSTNMSNTTTPSGIHTSTDPLLLSTRSQQNFAEFVPLALLLSTIAEANNAITPRALKLALSTLLAARVLHVEAGILREGAMGLGRPVGFYSTLGVIGWLGWAAGRGVWGL